MEQSADRERAQARRREPERLAELDRERGDAARVLLGRGVLLGQAHHQRADTGAEERLLGDDDLGGPQVADERARLPAAAQVVGDRRADERDPDELEDVAEPPAEIHEAQHERPIQRGRSRTSPTTTARSATRRVSRKVFAARTASAPKRTSPNTSSAQRGVRTRIRHARDKARDEHAEQADGDDEHGDRRLQADHERNRAGRAEPAQARQGEDCGTDRQRRGTGQRNHAVVPDEDPGGDQAVHREEGRHDREAACDDDGARIRAPRADGDERAAAAAATRALTPTP